MRTELNAIGCTVYGVDTIHPTAVDVQALRQLLYAHRVLVLKAQSLDERQFCNFAMAFANPVPAAVCRRHPRHPLIAVSADTEADAGTRWHSDGSFHKVPPVVTLLMPRASPHDGRRSTLFIDMSEVLEALPDAARRQLENAEFLHAAPGYPASLRPPVRHPAVITHPHTRERILYANRCFTIGVADRCPEDSATLLSLVLEFAERARFVREIAWSSGDILVWDNRFLQHRAGDGASQEHAVAHCIAASDSYPLCATHYAAIAAA